MTFQEISKMVLNRRRAVLVVIFMNTIYAFSYFQRVAIPGTIYNQLQSDLSLSAMAVTMLSSIYLYIYGGMQIFSGMLVDRFGAIRVILVGGIILSTSSILFPLSNSLAQLYITRALVGLGASLMYLSVIKELDISFSDRHFSALLSSSLFAGYVGGLVGTVPFERMTNSFGWRPSLVAVGIACFVVVCITALFTKHSLAEMPTQKCRSVIPAIKRVVCNISGYPVIFSSVIVFGNFFLMQAIIGKKFLEDCCGMNAGTAASRIFVLIVCSMCASVFTGFFSKAIGNRRKPILLSGCILGAIAPCLGMMVLKYGNGWIFPCYLLFGISSGASPIFSTTIKELNDPDYPGSSVGFSNAAIYIVIAFYASISGIVLDMFSDKAIRTTNAIHYPPQAYNTIFIGLFVLALLALLGCLFVRETFGQNLYQIQNIKKDI